MASQEAIKELGTNGGGFFNANSAHPFENPTPLSNFLEMLAILLIAAALCFTFGEMVGDRRQGWAILIAMSVLLAPCSAARGVRGAEGQSGLHRLGREPGGLTLASGRQHGRQGDPFRHRGLRPVRHRRPPPPPAARSIPCTIPSRPWAAWCRSCSSQLGEVVFGGVGSGLYTMLAFALLAVFVAGLMVGRTPEYLGKKIEAFEMKMISMVILITPLVVLVGTAVAVLLPAGQAGTFNPGAHGFSEILYAFSSAANNNGSAFAGISANTPFYNYALGIGMQIGRFWPVVAILAVAGALAQKKRIPSDLGTLPTHTPLFIACWWAP